jgi:hypothetical protein
MRNSKTLIFTTLLFLLVVSLLGLAHFTTDILINKLLVCGSLITGLILFRFLNNKTSKQKNEQF